MRVRTHLPVVVGIAVALAGVPLAGPPVLGRAAAASPGGTAQQAYVYHLPNLVSTGYSPTMPLADLRAGRSARLQGMVGIGESTVEVQNLARSRATVSIGLYGINPIDDLFARRPGAINDTTVHLAIEPLGVAAIALKAQPATTYSNYSGVVRSDLPLGVVARTVWDGGGTAVYEAPTAGRDLILPLFAIDAYSHTSVLWLYNASTTKADDVVMTIFDQVGGTLGEWTFPLRAGESSQVDPSIWSEFRDLPQNAGTGFLGAARLSCDESTAVIAYGDEKYGRGASAFVARPAAVAAAVQYLPLVRANLGGDSLLGIVNPANAAVDVTVSYLGAPGSPSGAGRSYVQSFSIPARYHAFIDLDVDRHRGSTPPANLPRGSSRGRGFFGGATVSATGPVLAMSLEQDARRIDWTNVYTVLASAAYNAFGPADLSRSWLVPQAYAGKDGRTTDVVVMNPGAAVATVRAEWGRLGSAMRGSSGPISVAPGQIGSVTVAPGEGGDPVQAVVRADVPIAALVYDLGPARDITAYWPVAIGDGVLDNVPTSSAPPTSTATRPAATTPPPTPTLRATNTASPVATTPPATASAAPPATATAPSSRVVVHLPVALRARR